MLSEIVDDPADAVSFDGAIERLAALRERFGVVAVVSGRPVDFLEERVPASLDLVGLYGLEMRRDGDRVDVDGSGAWREVVADTATHATARGPEGMAVENKGLSLTLHYRQAPELEKQVVRWAAAEASRSGLSPRPAKMSVELHPPIALDKGTAIESLADGLRAVLYAGDDVGDLPGFDALDRLAEAGLAVVRVAVRSEEAPDELLERADVVVDGPKGFRDLCDDLLAD